MLQQCLDADDVLAEASETPGPWTTTLEKGGFIDYLWGYWGYFNGTEPKIWRIYPKIPDIWGCGWMWGFFNGILWTWGVSLFYERFFVGKRLRRVFAGCLVAFW